MRVVLAKQRKRRPAQKQPAQQRVIERRPPLKGFNFLRPIWRWAQSKFARELPWRAFVSWQAYYAAYLRTDANQALLRHTAPYVGDPARQIELMDAMAAGRGPAIVSAPAGCGKSRFALELAHRMEREHRRWHVLFVRHDDRAVQEELHQLTQLKRVVFIVDDAQDCPELVNLLAAACAEAPAAASLQLVCLTRSTARARVARTIAAAFPTGTMQEIDLGRPSLQLVRGLIDELLPQSSPHHRETIARFVRQSYFGAVLVCGMLSREARLPQTFQRHDLRDRICRETLRAAADGVCPLETALRALAVYAALAPVSKASAEVREWAAELSGLAAATVTVLLDRMLAAGLFVESGDALIRPAPDLLGDLILEEACLDANGKPTDFSARLLDELLAAEPLATVRNCTGIGQLFGTDQEIDLVSRLVLERARTVAVGNKWDVIKLLQTAQPLAASRPATVVEVAGIMEERGILRRDFPAAESIGVDSVEAGVYELLMSAGEADAAAVPVALGLGRDLYAASREDGRSREHLLGELRACCRFEIGRSLAHAKAVADTLRAWISESDGGAAALCVGLSAQFLALEAQGEGGGEHTTPALRSPLNPLPEVWAVRDVIVGTLAHGMAHRDATVQCAAIASLERYGEWQEAPDQTWWEQWLPQLARETDRLSAALLELAQATIPLPVWAAAELQGWRWWAQQHDFLHRAGVAILRAIPDTDAYRLWKLLHEVRLPVHSALPEPASARSQDRLQHVQAISAAREEDTVEQAHRLFDKFDSRYADSSAWRALWLLVLGQTPQTSLQHHAGAVVGEFVRRHSEAAWSLVNPADADGPLFSVLPLLLAELGKQDRERRSREARNVPAGTRLEQAWLRALSFTSDFNEPELAVLARGLEATDTATVYRTADALLAAQSADRLTAFRRVFDVIARRPTDSELWELVIQQFVNWTEIVLPPQSGKPTDEMTQVADRLLTLLHSHGSHLRWGFQRHTRKLGSALAIIAVLCPRRLREWMQREWGKPAAAGARWNDESPLSVDRLPEIARLIADSQAAAQWVETFLDWMRHDAQLGSIGAVGLAELCSTDDIRVSDLAEAAGTLPTDASRKAFAEFVNHRKRRERPGSGIGTAD